VLGRALRNRRSRLVLIVAAVAAVLVALAAVAVATQRGDLASANEPQAKEPPTSLGIDPMKGTCPKVEPEKLPPDALAGATEAALDQVHRSLEMSKPTKARTPSPPPAGATI
jgi:hypothetical protein